MERSGLAEGKLKPNRINWTETLPLTFLSPPTPGCPSSRGSRSRRWYLQHKQTLIHQKPSGPSVKLRPLQVERTELLKPVQVDDVLRCSVVPGTDEKVGLLQDKVSLLPLLRVQHGSVAQQPDPLKLPSQQAVAAERRRSLKTTHGTVRKD